MDSLGSQELLASRYQGIKWDKWRSRQRMGCRHNGRHLEYGLGKTDWVAATRGFLEESGVKRVYCNEDLKEC